MCDHNNLSIVIQINSFEKIFAKALKTYPSSFMINYIIPANDNIQKFKMDSKNSNIG